MIYLTESADGVRQTPHETNFETQMNSPRDKMRQRRNLLRELAK